MQLTHTDLKPENILFVNSDSELEYDPKAVYLYLFSLLRAHLLKKSRVFSVFLLLLLAQVSFRFLYLHWVYVTVRCPSAHPSVCLFHLLSGVCCSGQS